MTDLFGTTESTELNNTVVDAPTTVATTQVIWIFLTFLD